MLDYGVIYNFQINGVELCPPNHGFKFTIRNFQKLINGPIFEIGQPPLQNSLADEMLKLV